MNSAEMLIDKEAVWGAESSDPPEDWDGITPYAIREGKLTLGSIELECAVLNDGRRIFTGEMIEELLSFINRKGEK